MADIELVIKIPEEIRLALINNIQLSADQQSICDSCINHAIINGTPLSKGHGVPKDADVMINKLCTHEANELFGSATCAEILDFIDSEKPIIEADKENNNIFKKMTEEEQTFAWMFMIFNKDKIIEKTEQWTKEAEEAGMTLTEYLESISPLNNKKSSWLQSKTGHWIIIDDCELFMAKCSECGEIVDSRMINKYPYCHCGAKMIKPQEREK